MFNPVTYANNIAILKTKAPFVFSSSIYPVVLDARQVTSGKAIVLGWGGTDVNSTITDNLHELQTEVMNTVLCGFLLPRVNEDNICTSGSNTTGIKSHDLGGPLYVEGEGLIGIQSFITGDSADGTPDMYASIFHHRSWVLNNT